MRLLPLALLAVTACRKDEFSPEPKFVDLYVELKLATVSYANDLEKANEVRRVILAQRHETSAAFHEHYARLMAHPEAWKRFQEDVVKRMEAFQASHKGETAALAGKVEKGK